MPKIFMLVNEPIRTPLGVRYLEKGQTYNNIPEVDILSLVGRGMACEVIEDDSGHAYTREELELMTVQQLRDLAKKANISDASILRKVALIDSLIPFAIDLTPEAQGEKVE